MKLQVIGCSHHNSSVQVRERLAFTPDQARCALEKLRERFPSSEAVLISTCNRVELYTAAEEPEACPNHHDVVEFLAEFHGVQAIEIFDDMFERTGEDAVRHLFTVAASLDSMVVGEAQILSQVKQAYELATSGKHVGPLTHSAFQAAIRVAKRVATETAINQRRVSIPSVAVADFASQIFERFDDKHVLVIGAGEMAEETLRYLIDEGASRITIVNRRRERAEALAQSTAGAADDWGRLHDLLIEADLVVSTTGATEPIVKAEEFSRIQQARFQRPLFVLDLAVPRDFEPAIADIAGVYLYSIDDLRKSCEANRKRREKEWPKAERIIDEETSRFMAEWRHRSTGPTIRRLKGLAEQIKQAELQLLRKKIAGLDERTTEEIERFCDRYANKLLHLPLESLRNEAEQGQHHGLLDALKRLFQLRD